MRSLNFIKKETKGSAENPAPRGAPEVPGGANGRIGGSHGAIPGPHPPLPMENGPGDNPQESGECFRWIFDEGSLGMAIIDSSFHFVRTNTAFCRMLGYTQEEMSALTFKKITHKDHLAVDAQSVERLYHGELPHYRTEKRYIRKDGSSVWGALTLTAIRSRSGLFLYFLAMIEDITARKQAAEALVQSERKYRQLFESANDAIFLMDVERFIDCNSNTLAMFGCGEKDDIVGHSPIDFSPENQPDGRSSKDKAREFISRALEGRPQRFFWKHSRKDGALFDTEVSLTSIVIGEKPHLLAIVREVTEKKQAELLQNAVYQISQAADKSAGLNELFKSVHRIVGTVMPAGNFYIALYDAEKDLISFPYFVDEADPPPPAAKPGKGLTEFVLRTGRPLLCDDATDKALRQRGDVVLVGAPSAIWIGVPLIVENKTIGVMVVQHYSDPRAYGRRELDMLEFVSSQVARSIERKRAEEALRASETILRVFIDALPGPAMLLDRDEVILEANETMARSLGRPRRDVIGNKATNLLAGEIAESRRSRFLSVVETGRPAVFEDNPAGKSFLNYMHPVLDEKGTLSRVAVYALDMTDRKRAEEALSREKSFSDSILESLPGSFYCTAVVDHKLRYVRWNTNQERTLGYSAAEMSVLDPVESIAPEDRDLVAQKIKEVMSSGSSSTEAHLYTKDKRKIPVLLTGSRTEIEGRTYLLGTAINIARQQQAEDDLRQSVSKLRTTLKEAIDSLASAIEMRDPYTAGHQERVTRLACAVAAEMGLTGERIEGIQIAGVIHNIGKLYVPAEILSKPTKLSDLEYSMIKMHAQVGYTILGKIDFPWPIAQIVHQHHECVNGSGYPLGLAGKDILLEAKILCVADVVEAMSSHRPYRPALGIQAALQEISQKRGILYDREVVDACLRLFLDKKFKFE